jgi:hypothetical protein
MTVLFASFVEAQESDDEMGSVAAAAVLVTDKCLCCPPSAPADPFPHDSAEAVQPC